MKTRIIKVTFVAVIAMASAINVFKANKENALSDIALANVEALADSEAVLSDCTVYCTPDDRYTCIIVYSGGAENVTCLDHRKK